MQVSCETDKSYWRGMIAWPQYEFIWDISNDNKSSNPKDWDRPRKITNLHKIVIKERALHMVLDDPNVCDDIKDYWWSQEYDILKNNKFRVSSRCPNFYISVDTCYYTCYNIVVRKGWRSVKGYSSREIIKILKADGWYEIGCTGDHHQFKHPVKRAVLP